MGKRIWNIAGTVVVVLVVLLAVALAGVRLVGLEPYVILSGSMEPVYPVGSLVYVQRMDADEIAVGDPIAFVMNEDLVVAIHRVIGIDAAAQQFQTKGDANDTADAAPVHFNNLIGKPVFCVPKLGYVSSYLTSPPGMYVGGAAALVLLLLMFVPDWIRKVDSKETAKQPGKARQSEACRSAEQPSPARRPVAEPGEERSSPAKSRSAAAQREERPAAMERRGAAGEPQRTARRTRPLDGQREEAPAKRPEGGRRRPAAQPDPHSARARQLATERAMAEAERALREAEQADPETKR